MKKQTISEIIDQRLDAVEIGDRVSRFAGDAEYCETWRNYHLIGDVISGDVSSGRCLMNRLRDALDGEPTVLAPGAMANNAKSSDNSSQSGPQKTGLSSDAAKSAGLFAVAASVALVAVLTLSPTTPAGPQGTPATIAKTDPLPASIESGTSVPGTPVPDASTPGTTQQTTSSEFDQMLVEHGEFSSTSGLNGLIAYAKLVTNEQLND